MVVRDEVREAQRALAALDAAHGRAVAHLDQVLARRQDVLVEADRQVAAASDAVEAAVAEMARQVSAELTAAVLGLDVAEVRRAVKNSPSPSSASGGRSG